MSKNYKYVKFIHSSGVEMECEDCLVHEIELFNDKTIILKKDDKSFLVEKIIETTG